MKRLSLCLAVVLVALLAGPHLPIMGDGGAALAASAKAKPQPKDAESVIRAIYEQYSKEAGPAEAEQQSFSQALYGLWIDVQRGANGVDQVGVDFDVFLDAQDLDAVTDLSTTFAADGAGKGTVVANFTASQAAKQVTYAMVKTAKGWKIDNIIWGGKHGDLRKALTAIKAEQVKSQ